MALVVLVVELDVPDDSDGGEALAVTARRVLADAPVKPRRVWAGVRDTAEAVASLHGGWAG